MTSVVDEQAFSQEVLESSTPVLVHFWAPWCGVCRMIEPVLETFAKAAGAELKLVGVNADENLKLASDYRIKNLPTVMMFREGKVIYRLDQLDRRDLLPLLKGLLPGNNASLELLDSID